MYNFLDSYDSKLEPLHLIITTNIVLLAQYRSRSPLKPYKLQVSSIFSIKIIYVFMEVCHPRCVFENWNGYSVKHKYVN